MSTNNPPSWGAEPEDDLREDDLRDAVNGAEQPDVDLECDDDVIVEGEATFLDDEQLARAEALTRARVLLLVPGFLGATPPLDAAALTFLAEFILKGGDEDADEELGTDAETHPTDGGPQAITLP